MNSINKKGFTLIETLMVIALIGIISLILVPNIIFLINKNKTESCENLKKNIISATKIYVNENKYDLKFTCDNTIKISIDNLIKFGKLSGDIKDPTNEEVNLTNEKVEVKFNCNTKQFTYNFNYTCK